MADAVARPFVKSAGGKTQLLPELMKYVPENFGHYYEPFIGGGALFFHLYALGLFRSSPTTQSGPVATIGDSNELLIKTYRAIRNDVDTLIEWLRGHERNYIEGNEQQRAAYFQSLREALGTPGNYGPDANEAARYISLNKTAFNGLMRFNKAGKYNVPHGRYANPTICDEENLRACSEALQWARIPHADFEVTVATAKRGDLVYMDCPYAPVSSTANFTSYTKDGFGIEDQKRLRDCARTLKARGVHVILSNADVPLVRDLYDIGFNLHEVQARRNVNSVATKRGKVGELIIT